MTKFFPNGTIALFQSQREIGKLFPSRSIDGAVAWWSFSELFGEGNDLAMNGRRGGWLFLQGEAFNSLTEAVGKLSLASVTSLLAGETGEPLTAILG